MLFSEQSTLAFIHERCSDLHQKCQIKRRDKTVLMAAFHESSYHNLANFVRSVIHYATNAYYSVTRSVVAMYIVTASVFRRRCIDVADISCGILGQNYISNIRTHELLHPLLVDQSSQIVQMCSSIQMNLHQDSNGQHWTTGAGLLYFFAQFCYS